MNNNKPTVTSITQVNAVNPATKVMEPHLQITWKVGDHGPFVDTFPKAGLDPNQVQARLQEDARKIGIITGP